MIAHELSDSGVEPATREQGGESLFTDEELQQFEIDDRSAGTAIAKILSTLFIYTLLAMSIAVWWTFRTVFN